MSEDLRGSRPLLCSLREIAGDDCDFIREVLDVFLVETPQKLASLEAAIEQGDVRTVIDVAHSLKGSAIAVDAEVLHGLSESLEHTARKGSLSGAADTFSNLTREVLRIQPIFEAVAAASPTSMETRTG